MKRADGEVTYRVRPARPTWRAQGRALRMRRRLLTKRAMREALDALMNAPYAPSWPVPPVASGALWEPMTEDEP